MWCEEALLRCLAKEQASRILRSGDQLSTAQLQAAIQQEDAAAADADAEDRSARILLRILVWVQRCPLWGEELRLSSDNLHKTIEAALSLLQTFSTVDDEAATMLEQGLLVHRQLTSGILHCSQTPLMRRSAILRLTGHAPLPEVVAAAEALIAPPETDDGAAPVAAVYATAAAGAYEHVPEVSYAAAPEPAAPEPAATEPAAPEPAAPAVKAHEAKPRPWARKAAPTRRASKKAARTAAELPAAATPAAAPPRQAAADDADAHADGADATGADAAGADAADADDADANDAGVEPTAPSDSAPTPAPDSALEPTATSDSTLAPAESTPEPPSRPPPRTRRQTRRALWQQVSRVLDSLYGDDATAAPSALPLLRTVRQAPSVADLPPLLQGIFALLEEMITANLSSDPTFRRDAGATRLALRLLPLRSLVAHLTARGRADRVARSAMGSCLSLLLARPPGVHLNMMQRVALADPGLKALNQRKARSLAALPRHTRRAADRLVHHQPNKRPARLPPADEEREAAAEAEARRGATRELLEQAAAPAKASAAAAAEARAALAEELDRRGADAANDVLDWVVEALEAAHAIYARRLVIALYSTKEFAHVLRRLTPLMYVPWLRLGQRGDVVRFTDVHLDGLDRLLRRAESRRAKKVDVDEAVRRFAGEAAEASYVLVRQIVMSWAEDDPDDQLRGVLGWGLETLHACRVDVDGQALIERGGADRLRAELRAIVARERALDPGAAAASGSQPPQLSRQAVAAMIPTFEDALCRRVVSLGAS